jgi:hypothetical protein
MLRICAVSNHNTNNSVQTLAVTTCAGAAASSNVAAASATAAAAATVTPKQSLSNAAIHLELQAQACLILLASPASQL